jgi:hypothetical protein
LDADNVLIRNADELFLCGDFCAVFMNPCHFHTGLLVIKPDQKEYERLLNSLDHLESFDGADQGFLSSMYSEILRKSQLFIPSKARKMQQKKLPKAMRLSVGYNINHKYFYEQYHWKLFFLRHFASLTSAVSPVSVVVESARPIPALTLGFPMAPILKPWYWWACFFMDLHHVWHDIRATLPFEQERFGLEQSMKTLSRFGLTLFLCSIIFLFVKKHIPIGTIREFFVHANIQNNYYTKKAFLIFRILLVLLAIRVSPTWIHRLAPIQYAFSLYIFIHVTWLVFFACCISSFWQYSQQTWLPPLVQYMEFWIYVCLTLLIDWIVLWSSTWQIFPNILWRLVFLATMCFISGCWQVVFFKLALKVEFGGKKERLRSL